jgi:hypothetical protein
MVILIIKITFIIFSVEVFVNGFKSVCRFIIIIIMYILLA